MQKNIRWSELDFIKIVATSLIVCHHFQQMLEVKFEYINFFYGSFYFGYLVEMFFIISGICAFRWIHQISEEKIGFINFYKKRIKRLLPLTALSVIVNAGFMIIYHLCFGEWIFGRVPSVKGIIFACLGMQDGWFVANPMINNPIWYISVLLLCYIWFYILTYIANKVKISPYILYFLIIILGIIIIKYGISFPFFNNDAARGYSAFFFGICLGKMITKVDVQKYGYQIVAATCLIVIIGTWVLRGEMVYERDVVSFLLWPSIIVLCKSKMMMKLYNANWLKRWDEYSFDTYIWHVLVLYLVCVLFKVTGWSFIKTYIGMILTVVIAFGVGKISHKYISVPINNFITKMQCSVRE